MCQEFAIIAALMPNTSSAKKKLRADARKTVINKRIKEKIRNTYKKFISSPSLESLSQVYSSLDIAVKKRVLSKQKVGRKKSQVSKEVELPKLKQTKRPTKSKSSKAKTA